MYIHPLFRLSSCPSLSLSPSFPVLLIFLWMAHSSECFPPSKPLLSSSMWLCFKRNPWCGAGENRDMWISPSLKVCVRSGRKGDTVWNHQHILGFEDPIRSLLSLCLWLTPAVSNMWHSQNLLGVQKDFLVFFLRISFIHVHRLKLTFTLLEMYCVLDSLGSVPFRVG